MVRNTPLIYVLDTNVLLHDPDVISAFPGHDLVIPIDAIEEVEQFRGQSSEIGHNARQLSMEIERRSQKGSLAAGLSRPEGGTLRVFVGTSEALKPIVGVDWKRHVNRALICALNLKEQGSDVVLVSQSTNVRIKANALNIPVVGYESVHTTALDLYQGWQVLSIPNNLSKRFSIATLPEAEQELLSFPALESCPHNHGLIVQNGSDRFSVWRKKGEQWTPSLQTAVDTWGITARNPQQQLALDLLLDPAITLVTLVGKAGTGKTLLALAAGLQAMFDESRYKKMMVSRPIFPMGKDLGYLPGTAQEKLEPWMQPIFDNLEQLIDQPVSRHNPERGYQALINQGLIQIEPLTYIRGRSIPDQFMVVDEAQNLTPHEIKTILTRVGERTKIVFTGDPFQIDSPYLDLFSNGLTHIVERFKAHPASGHVTLVHGERSALAESAADLL